MDVVTTLKATILKDDIDACQFGIPFIDPGWQFYFNNLLCFGFRHTGKSDAPLQPEWNKCAVYNNSYPDTCDRWWVECICYLSGYILGIYNSL